jgi:uncharacterized protein
MLGVRMTALHDETSTPDPRSQLVEGRLEGSRCTSCGYRLAGSAPRCPACGGTLSPALFGPGGTLWSRTTLRVPVQERPVPYILAYVDLDEGPRVLAHVEADPEHPPAVGARVRLSGTTPEGDLSVAPL